MALQQAAAFAALACLVLVATAGARESSNWGGLPERLVEKAFVLNTRGGESFDEETSPWVEQVGLHPRAFYFHNFLTHQERAHILRQAAPYMKRSTVVGQKGEGVVDEIRTSYGMFIRRLQDPVIERVERRISLWTHLPIENQEDIQVLRYQKSQTYGAHFDSGNNPNEPGPHWRLATFLMYLSDVEEGGETAFPDGSVWADPSMEGRSAGMSDCAKGHVAAKPKAGDAVLFYSYHPNGTMDPAAMHTGCPVIKGIKWAAPVWIHDIPFRGADFKRPAPGTEPERDPGSCRDYHTRCAEWAEAGECERNSGFMMGDSNNEGMCRKACRNCEACYGGDLECINRNRAKGGYLKLDKKEFEWLGVDWWGEDVSPEL